MATYTAAPQKAPGDAELPLNLSLARTKSTPPQLELALQNVQEVIQPFPNKTQAYFSKANIRERMGSFDEAEAALPTAVESSAGMNRTYTQRSLANMRTKRAEVQALRRNLPEPQNPHPLPTNPPPVPLQSTVSTLSNLGLSVVTAHETVKLHKTGCPYQYADLVYSEAQIRLLTLYPASDRGAAIECSLAITTLPVLSGSYEALSYVWGDQSTKHQIMVDEYAMDITLNLYNALCYLRHDTRLRTLWVDAICINQADHKEKNHQVMRMRDIYSNASRVLIWLGESDDDIDAAFEYLRLPKEIKESVDQDKPIGGLRKIYGRPWWTRMWVIQELIAAIADPLVICGNKSIDWTPVCDTLTSSAVEGLFNLTGRTDKVVADPISSIILFSQKRHGSQVMTLDDLLHGTRSHDASDPRDHVYALLGIVSDNNSTALFQADYTKPVRVAYQNAMAYLFGCRQDLDWLSYASGKDGATELPSWCANFSRKDWWVHAVENGLTATEPTSLRIRHIEKGASNGLRCVEVFHDPERGIIRLLGAHVGVIKDVLEPTISVMAQTTPAYSSIGREELSSAVTKDLENLLTDTFFFHIFARVVLEKRFGPDEAAKKLAAGDVWKVATGGLKFEDLLPEEERRSYNRMDGFALLEKVAQKFYPVRADLSHTWSHLLPDEPANFTKTAVNAYIGIARRTRKHTRYFTTDEGFIGFAYYPVQEGDVLCILYGCKYPVVLRPQDNGSYNFVALTYTDGIMEGEFLRDNNLIREEVFSLV